MAEGSSLEQRLAAAEAALDAIRRHEVDAVVGTDDVLLLRLREVERELRAAAARDRFRLVLGETLRPLRDPVAIRAAACDALRHHLGARAVRCVRIPAGADDVSRSLVELTAGRTVVVETGRAGSRPSTGPGERALGIPADSACVLAPLRVSGDAEEVLVVEAPEPRRWDANEVALIEETAERMRAAVQHALADDAARRDEAALSAVLEALPVGVAITSADGHLVRDNAAFRALWGTTSGSAPWEEDGPFVASWPDTGRRIERAEWAMSRALSRGEVTRDELVRCVRRDGDETRYVLNHVAPIRDPAGAITGAVGVMLDVTARLEAEQALRASERALLEADRRKDRFLATLAHELRNPLAPIRTAVEVLATRGGSDPDLVSSRSVITRQVGRMARLLDELLDVSRITHEKLVLKPTRITLAEVVDAALETTAPRVDSHGHTLEVTLPDEPVWLDADAVRLSQVLSNLLDNASKYTPAGGRIRLAAWIERTEAGGHEVVVSVVDSGIGLSAAALPQVFDLFSQADARDERSEGGLGLGLFIVRQLVELHGGSVAVHSDGPGRGTEFVIRLPLPTTGGGYSADAESTSIHGSTPRRVLVVDDNRDAADSLALLLRLSGHETETAYDGVEAVERTEAFAPEVVLLDLGLPRLSGYDACRRIRALSGGAAIAVIALSGMGQESDRRRSAEAGFDTHLVKPVDPAALARLLAALPEPTHGPGPS